jgi:hypothetical protein
MFTNPKLTEPFQIDRATTRPLVARLSPSSSPSSPFFAVCLGGLLARLGTLEELQPAMFGHFDTELLRRGHDAFQAVPLHVGHAST